MLLKHLIALLLRLPRGVAVLINKQAEVEQSGC